MKKNIKRIVFLFGAGAMIEFGGPTTNELTNRCIKIIKDSNWGWLVSVLDKTYGKRNYNFETLIAAIEILLDWSIAHDTQGNICVNNTNIISTLLKTRHSIPSSEQIWCIYEELINCIIDRISEYDYYDHSNRNHIILHKYFENKIKSARTKVYSLNYDRLLPQIIRRKCADGTIKSNLDYAFFRYDLNNIFKSKWSYINLHGSIYLGQIPNNLYKVAQYDGPQHLKCAHLLNGGSPNENKLFSPIIVGYSKSQRILSEPFNFSIGSFMADCNQCDELYIVGCSLSDPHINSILMNYIHLDKTKVVIIDKKDNIEDITNNILYKFKNTYLFDDTEYGCRNREGNIIVYNNGFLNYMIESTNNDKMQL